MERGNGELERKDWPGCPARSRAGAPRQELYPPGLRDTWGHEAAVPRGPTALPEEGCALRWQRGPAPGCSAWSALKSGPALATSWWLASNGSQVVVGGGGGGGDERQDVATGCENL